MAVRRQNLQNLATPGFLVDYHSMIIGTGRQIDWAKTPVSYVDPVTGKKRIPAGKIVVTLPSGLAVPHDSTDADAATSTDVALLTTSADEEYWKVDSSMTGYGTIKGGVIYENMLPDSTGNPKVIPTALRNRLLASGQFVFEQRVHTVGV
jgi:hypothetical protein